MEPKNIRFGGGAAETIMHPLVVVAMLLAIALILLLPRKYAVVPLLFLTFSVPLGQVLVVAGIHLMVVRILIIVGWVRLVSLKLSSRRESLAGGFNAIDKAFFLWAFLGAFVFVLLYMEGQVLINRFGVLLDTLGGYFLLRFLIRDEDDVRRVIRVFAIIAGVMALSMLNEQFTQQNVFGFLGGHPTVPEIRDGQIRSQGVFGHSILAGCFGATLLPLLVCLWTSGKSKFTAVIGMVSATVITVTTWSSTPLLAYAAGVVGLFFWPLRKQMRLIRWGILITLAGLHMVMKAPVWALIARVDLIGASSGYHRFMLVDNFIRKFGDWWLLGTKDYDTWGWQMWDISNGYVAQGLTGGLVTFGCFVATIVFGFRAVGSARKSVGGQRRGEWFFWGLGAALFAHVVAFFGTGYWDQMQLMWFAFLAIISAATAPSSSSPAMQIPRSSLTPMGGTHR